MKNKKMRIIGIILLILGLCFIGAYILFNLKSDDNAPQPVPTKNYSSLLELAKEMYSDGSYTKLPKDYEKGVYYMSFGEYKKRGYNVDIVDSSCPDDFKIIYFDIDDTDNFNPIYTISTCNDETKDNANISSETSLIKIANELYENNEYLNFVKGDGGYYMTIGMYKSRGYDLSLIDTSCPDDSGIIFFDIDKKYNYEKNPVFIIYDCN